MATREALAGKLIPSQHPNPKGAPCALCARCAKSQLFSTTGSHRSQGPEFCTLQPLRVHQGFFCLPRVTGS